MVDISSLKVGWNGKTSGFRPKKGPGITYSKKTLQKPVFLKIFSPSWQPIVYQLTTSNIVCYKKLLKKGAFYFKKVHITERRSG
jgi:hypothetical protein